MTNTTETFWDVDGVSLQTYAFNIATLGGGRMTPPPVRGDDITVPFRPGSIWMPKVPDAKIITLAMWVTGANEDGTIPVAGNMRRQFDTNWRKLRQLLWNPRRQFLLTKRFWVLEADLTAGGMVVDDLPRSGAYRLLSASAEATFAGGLEPSMTGPGRAAFTVDLKLATPYFFSAPIDINFSLTTGTGLPGPNRTVTILGDDRTMAIGVDFVGPLTGPKIENSTDGVWMTYATSLLSAQIARIGVWDFDARHDVAGANTKAAGYVQHDGDPFWLFLEPGSNALHLTATGGTGTAKLTYQPGWL